MGETTENKIQGQSRAQQEAERRFFCFTIASSYIYFFVSRTSTMTTRGSSFVSKQKRKARREKKTPYGTLGVLLTYVYRLAERIVRCGDSASQQQKNAKSYANGIICVRSFDLCLGSRSEDISSQEKNEFDRTSLTLSVCEGWKKSEPRAQPSSRKKESDGV